MGGVAPEVAVHVFHVDYVLPGDAPPIQDGAVVVASASAPSSGAALPGTILDVGRAADVLPRHAGSGAEIVRVRGVAFPGLVNAHTHLELSAMRGKLPGGRGFVQWVESLIGHRLEVGPEEEAEGIDRAVEELVASGTVAVGEVTNTLAAVRRLAQRGIGGAVFHEVFGLDRSAVLRRVAGLRAELDERFPSWPSRDLAYAPSPHTLYTTHEDAVRALLETARRAGTRTSLHLAEHPAERRAIEQGDGTVPEWLFARTKQRSEWPKQPLFEYAERVGALSPGVLLVHLTDARPDELARVAERGCSVVLCPRSNLHIETMFPSLHAFRRAGIEPALGTDSLASNASLDVLAEAKALHDRFPDVPPWELVQMATWNGARALGRTDLGRLANGSRPGLFAVELDQENAPDDRNGTGSKSIDPAAFILKNLRLTRRTLASRTSGTVA